MLCPSWMWNPMGVSRGYRENREREEGELLVTNM